MAALILFGGGGDLAMRMLLPSLYFLEHDGLLPDGLKIIGAGGVRQGALDALLQDAGLDALSVFYAVQGDGLLCHVRAALCV